jgi:hypothetical protein
MTQEHAGHVHEHAGHAHEHLLENYAGRPTPNSSCLISVTTSGR